MDRGESTVFVSGKGGTGKTTAAANIGCGFAKLGKKTVIVDLDFGLRSCDLLLGLEEQVLYDSGDVLAGRVSLAEALLPVPRFPGLFLLPAPQRAESAAFSPEEMRRLLSMLSEEFDEILLDAPSGIGEGFSAATEECDRILLVLTQERASVRAADQVIRTLGGAERRKTALLLNRYRENLCMQGAFANAEEIASLLPADLLGVIPEDETVVVMGERGVPVTGRLSSAGQAYMKLCRQLTAE